MKALCILLSSIFLISQPVYSQDSTFDTTVDQYPYKVDLTSGQYTGFQIEYKNWYKVVTNLINNEKYALVCCNQTLNDTSGYHAVVNTPLDSVSVTELSALPFFELLSLSDRVKAAQPSTNVTSPCYDGITDSPQPGTSIQAIFTKATASNSAGVSYIGFSSDDTSLTPMEQSAWIVYLGYFFEKESSAFQIWNNVNDKYICHKEHMTNLGNPKKVAWTSYDIVNNAWTLSFNNYLYGLLKDSGMDLANQNNQTTIFSNINDFKSAIANVDYIIDDTPLVDFNGQNSFSAWLSAANYSLAASTPFISGKNVYRTDGLINSNGYSDWPIRQSARADLVISDVIHMVYNTYEPDYSMTWLRAFAQLAKSRAVSNSTYPSCTDPLARLNMNQCSLTPFDPNGNSTDTSSEDKQEKNLSEGGKAGVAVGVIVGLSAACIIGFFTWKKCSKGGSERTFYKMDDM